MHHFKSGLIHNKDYMYMRISGTEPSSLILSETVISPKQSRAKYLREWLRTEEFEIVSIFNIPPPRPIIYSVYLSFI